MALAAKLAAAASEPGNEPGDSAADGMFPCSHLLFTALFSDPGKGSCRPFVLGEFQSCWFSLRRGFTAPSEIFMEELGALVE